MATSGSKSITVTQWDTLKFSWSRSSYSIANNTSTIKWTLSLVSGSSGRIDSSATKDWSVTVNGTKYSGTNTVGIANNTTKTLASGTTTISHNADGTKTFSYSFSQEFAITFSGESIGTKSGSGSGTLDSIARKSSLSVSNGTLGTAQTLKITESEATFKHKLTYTCGNTSGYILGSSTTFSTSNSISWTPPVSLASQNTTGTTVSIKFTLYTYTSGGTSVGSNSYTKTFTMPSSVKPSCSISVSDASGYSVFVKGYSKFKITVTPTTSHGSAIASYSVNANGATYTTASVTTAVLASSGSLTITATVKDKRGRTGTATKTVTVYDKSSLTASNGTLDTSQTLTINSGTSKFTHNLTYKCGSTSGTVASGTSDTSISFKPPLNLAKENTTGASVSITYTLTTLCDGKSVGSVTKTVTCTIPSAKVKPSCTLNVSDSEGYYSTYGAYIKGLSKLKVTINPTLAYESPITSYSTTVNGKTYTDSTFTTPALTSPGTIDLSATVTDSRGNKSDTASKSVNVLDYDKPAITKLSVIRCDENGNSNPQGSMAKLVFSAKVYPLDNKNTASYTLYYKPLNATDYLEAPFFTLNNKYTVSDETWLIGVDINTSYSIKVSVTDNIGTHTSETTLSTGFTLMHFHREGKGIGIGKVSEDKFKDYLDIAMHTKLANNGYLCGTTTDGQVNRMLYTNASNNTIVGYGGYFYGFGHTNIYGNTLNFGVRAGGIGGTDIAFFKPYYEKGDSLIIDYFHTAGYISSSTRELFFTIPLSKPVICNPTVTLTSTFGFVLRQNAGYTHGSKAGGGVTPSSYETTLYDNHIRVKATFPTDSSGVAVNNSPIGIEWRGTITFE